MAIFWKFTMYFIFLPILNFTSNLIVCEFNSCIWVNLLSVSSICANESNFFQGVQFLPTSSIFACEFNSCLWVKLQPVSSSWTHGFNSYKLPVARCTGVEYRWWSSHSPVFSYIMTTSRNWREKPRRLLV